MTGAVRFAVRPRPVGAGNNPGLGADRQDQITRGKPRLTSILTAMESPPPLIMLRQPNGSVETLSSSERPRFHPAGWTTGSTMKITRGRVDGALWAK